MDNIKKAYNLYIEQDVQKYRLYAFLFYTHFKLITLC